MRTDVCPYLLGTLENLSHTRVGARSGKKWQTSRQQEGEQFFQIKRKSTMAAPTATKARAMDGFSFGFLTRLPKFRSQIQF